MSIRLPLKKKIKYVLGSKEVIGGMILLATSIFLLNHLVKEADFLALKIPANAPTTKGWVVSCWYWGTALNDKDYYGIDYEYSDPKTQQTYFWTSYSTSKKHLGESVTVEYVPGEASVSRIKNLTNTLLPPAHMVAGIFLFILSFVVLNPPLSAKFYHLYLLKNGKVAKGTLQKIRATSDKEKGKRVFRFQFSYVTHTGKNVTFLVHSYRKKQLSDEKEEILLYSEKKPDQVIMVDDFPPFIAEEIKQQAKKIISNNNT